MNSDDDSNLRLINALLALQDPLIQQTFTQYGTTANLTPDQKKSIEDKIQELDPEKNLEGLLRYYKTDYEKDNHAMNLNSQNGEPNEINSSTQPTSSICPKMVYDVTLHKHVSVAPPIRKRGRKENFNAYEFLTVHQADSFQLTFPDKDDLEVDLDILSEPIKDSIVDAHLRKIADVAENLNGMCNYKFLDVRSEKTIR